MRDATSYYNSVTACSIFSGLNRLALVEFETSIPVGRAWVRSTAVLVSTRWLGLQVRASESLAKISLFEPKRDISLLPTALSHPGKFGACERPKSYFLEMVAKDWEERDW
jgi:hypothetical protein